MAWHGGRRMERLKFCFSGRASRMPVGRLERLATEQRQLRRGIALDIGQLKAPDGTVFLAAVDYAVHRGLVLFKDTVAGIRPVRHTC